jgi:radical SAM protein with 4Fe4S-binding SPASM domain
MVEINNSQFNKFKKLFIRPAIVQIDLTNKCNLNCFYCYNKSNSLKFKEQSDEDLINTTKKVITQLNPLTVVFSGGEPLLRKEILFKLSKMLKENGINIHLNTNSLLIDENIAKELSNLGIAKISINIDSLKIQDNIRGGVNLLDKAMKSLEILEKYFPKNRISISCVVNALNYREIVEIAKFVKKSGYGEIHLLDMIPCNESQKKLLLSREQWLEFFSLYREIQKLGIKILPNHALLFLDEFQEKVKVPFCMAARFKMVITADGKIVPCNYFKEEKFVCGDALKDDLLKVWQDSEIMKKFRYFNPEEKICKKCENVSLCTGGCRAFARMLLGDPFRGDPYCVLYDLKNATRKERSSDS